MTTVRYRVGLMTVGGDAEHMADEASRNESFARRGNGNPGLRTLDSLYYDYARIKWAGMEVIEMALAKTNKKKLNRAKKAQSTEALAYAYLYR